MNAHYLQHVPFEGLGHIEDWLLKIIHEITATKFFENTNLPDVNPSIGFLLWVAR